jgi:uncharacterized protein YutE (UPF0331/DUF86 family)
MAPDVLVRKLAYLRQLLEDLAAFRGADAAEVAREHYKLERILELLATAASDTLHHLLAERGIAPESYRDTFRLAAEHGLLPADLAARLQKAAGMRNVLVHLYEYVDFDILHQSVEPALRDFAQLIAALEAQLPPIPQ